MPPKNSRKGKEEAEPIASSEGVWESAPAGKNQQPKKGRGKGKGKAPVISIDSELDSDNPLVTDEQEKPKSDKAASPKGIKTRGSPRTRTYQLVDENMTILKNALNNQSYKIGMGENFILLAEFSLGKEVKEPSKKYQKAIWELIRRELEYAHREGKTFG